MTTAARILSRGLGAAPAFSGGVEKERTSAGAMRMPVLEASTSSPFGVRERARGSWAARLAVGRPFASTVTALCVFSEAIHTAPPGTTIRARTSFSTSPAPSEKAASWTKAGFGPPKSR